MRAGPDTVRRPCFLDVHQLSHLLPHSLLHSFLQFLELRMNELTDVPLALFLMPWFHMVQWTLQRRSGAITGWNVSWGWATFLWYQDVHVTSLIQHFNGPLQLPYSTSEEYPLHFSHLKANSRYSPQSPSQHAALQMLTRSFKTTESAKCLHASLVKQIQDIRGI